MRECICSTCANLRDILGDEGPTGESECVHGYPDVACETCETGECEWECIHYVDGDSEPGTVTVQCSLCGKDMLADATDEEDGQIFCVDCYLKRPL